MSSRLPFQAWVGLRVRTCRGCEMRTRGRQPRGKFFKSGYVFPSD